MIEKGQIYRAVRPIESEPVPRYRRIMVIGKPMTIPGVYGFGTVMVVTLDEYGRERRMRAIKMSELHAKPFTKNGEHRKNGYVLEGQ